MIVLYAAALVILAGLLWWLLVATEGAYLGRRVVIWLYDLYADRYDSIKDFRPEYDHVLLAGPIMAIIAPQVAPMVLDVATGTGRLPLALVNHPQFQGRVIGVDLSRHMLAKAARKLDDRRVTFLRVPAEALPFPDASFDVVTCLEALEFMSDPEVVLYEMARVLRPGGLLLMTNRINTRLMPGKTFTDDQLESMLQACGIDDVFIEPWQVDYHRVWATRCGDSLPVGARPWLELLLCPECGGRFDASLHCETCSCRLQVNADGVFDRHCKSR